VQRGKFGSRWGRTAKTVDEVRRIARVECPEGYFDRKGERTAVGVEP
jgi:hypothetical protein